MKEVKIKLDEKSLEILKEIDPIHRETLINLGIRLTKESEFYKILKGEEVKEIVKINEEKPKTEESKEIGIDLSDLGGF